VNQEFSTEKPGRLVHHSTYQAVPRKWLGQAFLDGADFLAQVNRRAYEHEYLGIPNGTGGNVFENLELRSITEEERATFDWIHHGIDWGYFPDPWVYNRVYYDGGRHKLYVFGELTRYKSGNRATFQALLEYGVTEDDYLVCDSAEPKSIADYREYGLDAHGVNKSSVKGKGSVEYSVKWLQSLAAIIIDPDTCPDTAKEFAEYEYLRDKNGDVVSGYPDANNHHIDAVRYATAEIWRRRGE
jgi:phage terminase large subunit